MTAGIVRARGATARRVVVAITLVSALRAAEAQMVHPLVSGLKQRVIKIVDGELRVQEREDVLEGIRTPTKAMLYLATVTIAAVILDEGFAACFFYEK